MSEMPSSYQTLQNLKVGGDLRLQPLFYRCSHRNRGTAADFVHDTNSVSADPDTIINLDAFYNCFYESYWRELTSLESLFAALELQGAGVVRLIRHSPLRKREILRQLPFSGERQVVVISVPNDGTSRLEFGRLVLEIEATESVVTVFGGRWMTEDHPLNVVSVTAVICTFNKEAMLLDNLSELSSSMERLPELSGIIVVDQGTNAVTDHPKWNEVSEHYPETKLSVMRQGNFGGAGGFTRGIIESLKQKSTHTLLMDDDIRIDDDVLVRLIAFLRYLRKPATVGGAMFDLFRPLRMHAADEATDLMKLTHINRLHDTDFSALKATDVFLEPGRGTYNGWWFCCFPNLVIEKYGLPMPFFIRGDDTEYGERISAAGETVVTLPSIFVWHEPFYAKFTVWFRYYERRNFLIIAVLHSKATSLELLDRSLRPFLRAIANSNYELAAAKILALEHYLKGPSFVFHDPRSLHKEILSNLALMRGGAIGSEKRPMSKLELQRPRILFLGLIRMLIFQVFQAPKVAKEISSETKVFHMAEVSKAVFVRYKNKPFGILNPHSNETVYFQPNRATSKNLLWRAMKASVVFLFKGPQIAAAYRAASKAATSKSFWQAYLELDDRHLVAQEHAATKIAISDDCSAPGPRVSVMRQ